jgi:WD40 repeat protein
VELDLVSDNFESAKGHSSVVLSLVFSPDGKLVVSGSYDSTRKLWTTDGVRRGLLQSHSGSFNYLTFSPHSHLIVSDSSDKTIRVWNAANGNTVAHTRRPLRTHP